MAVFQLRIGKYFSHIIAITVYFPFCLGQYLYLVVNFPNFAETLSFELFSFY